MIPADFCQTGLSLLNAPERPVTQFQVIGERSSGTNFVKRLLGRNTDARPNESFGWKHAPNPFAVEPNTAIILVVRQADDWTLSMHRKPWHASPALQQLSFSDFIRAPWNTVIDRPRYFKGLFEGAKQGAPLILDQDPETDAPYTNVFALRVGKLRRMLYLSTLDVPFAMVRMEDAVAEPQIFMGRLSDAMKLPRHNNAFRPVRKRLGARFKPAVPTRPTTPTSMTHEDRSFMLSQLDMRLEAALGYSYEDE